MVALPPVTDGLAEVFVVDNIQAVEYDSQQQRIIEIRRAMGI